MISLRTASLVTGLFALVLLAAFQASVRVASADTPSPQAGLVIIHKHCEPDGAVGTFPVALDFEFEPGDLTEIVPIDENTAFDNDTLEISCGDNDSTTADGDTISLAVGTDLGGLPAWYAEVGPMVDSATVTIREFDLPEGVTATYAGCDFDEADIQTITLGWVCVITNTIEEPDDDDGDDPDCPCDCCGFDLDLDIDNDNTNVISIDNDNTNDNANDNANENDNENANENENNNENTNTQNQTNNQDQDNENKQTNNITSGPEVNISGVAPHKPADPKPVAGGSIKPPSTGDAGLAAGGDGLAPAVLVLLGSAVMGAAAARTVRREG